MNQLRADARNGFSLVEILVVITIIGILMAAIIPAYSSYKNSTSKRATTVGLKNIVLAIEQYQEDMDGELPGSLKDLVKKPAGEKADQWGGPYITTKGSDVPKDGWKNPFHYAPTPGSEHPYELYSYGKEGKGSKSGRIDAWKI